MTAVSDEAEKAQNTASNCAIRLRRFVGLHARTRVGIIAFELEGSALEFLQDLWLHQSSHLNRGTLSSYRAHYTREQFRQYGQLQPSN